MDSFATRSALIAVWITIGAFGAMFLAIGAVQLYGGIYLVREVGDPLNMSGPVLMLAVPLFLTGLAITLFCIRRIWKTLTKPMTPGKNARAETPVLRLLAIAAFTAGTALGAYGLYKRGGPVLHDIKEIAALETVPAKVVTIDRVDGEREEKSGSFVYYVNNDLKQRHEGVYEKMFPNQVLKPGRTFNITYLKNDPVQYFIDRPKPNPIYLLPGVLQLLIIFWLVSAGLTGIRANLGPDEDGDHEYYGGYGNPPGHDPAQYKSAPGIQKNSGFGKFRGIK